MLPALAYTVPATEFDNVPCEFAARGNITVTEPQIAVALNRDTFARFHLAEFHEHIQRHFSVKADTVNITAVHEFADKFVFGVIVHGTDSLSVSRVTLLVALMLAHSRTASALTEGYCMSSTKSSKSRIASWSACQSGPLRSESSRTDSISARA